MVVELSSEQETRLEFFEYLFGTDFGYICIATQRPGKRDTFKERYFEWPEEREEMLRYVDGSSPGHNVWFGVNLLSLPKRLKENCVPSNLVWADLDTCTPDIIEIPPQCVIESSPGRFQAIWRLDQKIEPDEAEDLSKRIARKYEQEGADQSGWDLTQLLRVPGTLNFKYTGLEEVPEVKLITSFSALLNPSLFKKIQPPFEEVSEQDLDDVPGMPDIEALPNPDYIIYEYRMQLGPTRFAALYGDEPAEDWSRSLWNLILLCLEVGMNVDETFSIAFHSKCNKYKRDGRPISHLWKEVLKAETQQRRLMGLMEAHEPLHMPQLLSAKETDQIGNSVIHDYLSWASEATDAVEEYHELSCAVLLSSLIASGLHLKVEWGKLVPNLWGLILGDTTLTRKTTAMQMAMDFLVEIDPEIIVATDGSAEGILTALSTRPKMTSVYYRDEVAGFFDAIQRKDYLAGLPETFTKLYDVPAVYPRRLRKEVITLIEPVFIFFGGGIIEKTYSLISEDYIISGFIPRFLVVTGRTDTSRVRPTGPPRNQNVQKRNDLKELFVNLHSIYAQSEIEVEAGGHTISIERTYEAILTDDAWERFTEVEQALTKAAYDSAHATLALPTFQRMAFSGLKLSILFAAARQEPTSDAQITVEKRDILESTHFIQRWGKHMVDLIKHAGQSRDETKMNAVFRTIERFPGVNRGVIMQRHHLNKRMMDDIESTLEERMMIQVKRKGNKQRQYWAIGR